MSKSTNKVKLYQLPGYGFPGLHAESFQTARMAEGFLECGIASTVVYPWSSKMIPWREVGSTYGLQQELKRKFLKGAFLTTSSLRLVSNPLLRRSLKAFAMTAGKHSFFLGRHPHLEPLSVVIDLKKQNLFQGRIFVEIHEPSHYLPATDQLIDGYIVVSETLQQFLLDQGVSSDKILLAPNAVSLKPYEISHRIEQSTLRETLGLPKDKQIVCYTGQLGPGRNIETLIEAVELLGEQSFLVIVGGRNPDDIKRLQEFIDARGLTFRVTLAGQQPTAKTINFQLAADVLVIPYNSGLAHSNWCSPLKLGEYLATGKLIAAFPIAPLRKALSNGEVVWANEETSQALATAIAEAFTRKPRGFAEVRERLGQLTWAHRARQIATFMGIDMGIDKLL